MRPRVPNRMKHVMRCDQDGMDARRGAPARVVPLPSGATPQTPVLVATRRDVGVWAHRGVAPACLGTTQAAPPRLALHPKHHSRTRVSSCQGLLSPDEFADQAVE